MKDDLLIRFIDGKTTPEETELVLKELSQDGPAAKEWMQMAQGARLADTEPIVNIDAGDFIARTLAKKSEGQSAKRKVVRLPWILSGITAVAASIAVVATVFMNNDNTEMPQNVIVETQDSSAVLPDADSTFIEEAVDIKDASRQAVAEVTVPEQKEQVTSPELKTDPSAEQMQTEEEPAVQTEEESAVQTKDQPLILEPHINQQDSKATASKIEGKSFEMIRPAKSPYRVRVKNPEKEFVFEWKMSNASDVRFSIADKDGKVIIDNEWISESRYGVVAADLVDRGELDWTVEVTFNDGSMQRKTGKIELVSINE